MISKKLVKEVCIHEASHLYIAKVLGYEILSMELYSDEGFARVAHSSEFCIDSIEAAIKVAGWLGDKIISKRDVRFRSAPYLTQLTENGIIFGDYDEFKLLVPTTAQERKIIRIVTKVITENKKTIKAIADFFISKNTNGVIVVGKHRLKKLFKDLGISEKIDVFNKLST